MFDDRIHDPSAQRTRDILVHERPGQLADWILFNRTRLQSQLDSSEHHSSSAILSLKSARLNPQPETALRVAIVLTMGRPSDRRAVRAVLRKAGPASAELVDAIIDAMGHICHPAAAFLLLPLLTDASPKVRCSAFGSLLAMHHHSTSESLMAAACEDDSCRRLLIRVVRHQSQQECNRLFESFERAARSDSQLGTMLQTIQQFTALNPTGLLSRKEDTYWLAPDYLEASTPLGADRMAKTTGSLPLLSDLMLTADCGDENVPVDFAATKNADFGGLKSALDKENISPQHNYRSAGLVHDKWAIGDPWRNRALVVSTISILIATAGVVGYAWQQVRVPNQEFASPIMHIPGVDTELSAYSPDGHKITAGKTAEAHQGSGPIHFADTSEPPH